MDAEREIKSVVCSEAKVDRADGTNLYIEGYGAYFGNVDSYGDIIQAGAFKGFLASEDAQRVKLCNQHNFDEVLGVIEEMREDERGLWFRAKISNTTLGKDAATLIEDGALNEFSIGYAVRAAEYPEGGEVKRILTDIYLYEISLVSRAANPKAVLEGVERKGEELTNQNTNIEEMEEMKKMQEELESLRNENTALEAAIAEAKADKGAIEEMKASLAKNDEAIRNLDESISKMYDAIKESNEKEQTASEALCAAIKSEEFRQMVEDVVEGKRASGKMEVKISTGNVTGTVLTTIGDTNVNATAQQPLAFLDRLSRKDVPQDKSVALWLEGSFTDKTNYVGEGSAIGSADGAAVEEKTRAMAKIAAKLPFTRETATDMSYFLNWAREEAIRAIRGKVDTEIVSGAGADTNATTKKKVYGIVGQGSTAFSASTAGVNGVFAKPDLINLVDACDAQIYIGTHGEYVANAIYMHPSDFAKYKNMKDNNGALLFESNGGIYTFLGKQVIRTAKLSAGQMLVGDFGVVSLYEKLGFEVEVERVASTDSYVLYLRWRGQIVVPTSKKLAIIYISSIASALSAMTAASGSGSGSANG